jgi:uncharacterized protein (DUF305 family)
MAEKEPNSFDAEALKAEAELKPLVEALTPEQKQAIAKLQQWWSRWYMKAGHKRLGRLINNIRA